MNPVRRVEDSLGSAGRLRAVIPLHGDALGVVIVVNLDDAALSRRDVGDTLLEPIAHRVVDPERAGCAGAYGAQGFSEGIQDNVRENPHHPGPLTHNVSTNPAAGQAVETDELQRRIAPRWYLTVGDAWIAQFTIGTPPEMDRDALVAGVLERLTTSREPRCYEARMRALGAVRGR